MELLFSRMHSKSEAAPGLQTPDGLFVSIPDSLEIVDGMPKAWYFTNKEHQLKRKHTFKLDDNKLLRRTFGREFGSPDEEDVVANSGIVCTYTTWSEGGITVKYFTSRDVGVFLDDIVTRGTGILQRFVGCRGRQHHTYLATWRKGSARISRATNRAPPNKKPAVWLDTFEPPVSPDVTVEELSGDSYLASALQHLSFLVIQRLQHVAAERLDMVSEVGSPTHAGLAVLMRAKVDEADLEFALGVDGSIYLLRCWNLRFANVPPVTVSHIASLSRGFSSSESHSKRPERVKRELSPRKADTARSHDRSVAGSSVRTSARLSFVSIARGKTKDSPRSQAAADALAAADVSQLPRF